MLQPVVWVDEMWLVLSRLCVFSCANIVVSIKAAAFNWFMRVWLILLQFYCINVIILFCRSRSCWLYTAVNIYTSFFSAGKKCYVLIIMWRYCPCSLAVRTWWTQSWRILFLCGIFEHYFCLYTGQLCRTSQLILCKVHSTLIQFLQHAY